MVMSNKWNLDRPSLIYILKLTNMLRWTVTWFKEPIVIPVQYLFNEDFTTATDAELINRWRNSVWVDYWLTTSASWLHWVNYVTDSPACIEFPVWWVLTWKTITFEMEWDVQGYGRWGWIWISIVAGVWTWREKNDNKSTCDLVGFPMYASSTTYDNMGLWRFNIYENSSWTNISWDQPRDIHMNNYVDVQNWIWKASWTFDLSTLTYNVNLQTIWTTTSSNTFTRTFSTITSAVATKIADFLAWNYWNLSVEVFSARGYGDASYDYTWCRNAKLSIQ